jgi:hypothetical protein
VLHWAWNGTQLYFWPLASLSVDEVNAVLNPAPPYGPNISAAKDNVITVSRADFGRVPQDNLALAFVHGVDMEFASASKNGIKFNGKTRVLYGTADADPRRTTRPLR